jgi:hypothetical protein
MPVGSFLILAAGLKAWGVSLEPNMNSTWLSGPAAQLLLLQLELLLAIWLLSAWFIVGSCSAAISIFLCFALTNLYQGLSGQRSCACFGSVHVHPWYVLLIDLAALTMLILALHRHCKQARLSQSEGLRLQTSRAVAKAAGVGVGVVGILGVLTCVGVAAFGSPGGALAHLRNARVSVSPRVLDVGLGEPSESRAASIELQNWTDQPVTFLGGTDDCAFCLTKELPVTVPAGERMHPWTVAEPNAGRQSALQPVPCFRVKNGVHVPVPCRLEAFLLAVVKSVVFLLVVVPPDPRDYCSTTPLEKRPLQIW